MSKQLILLSALAACPILLCASWAEKMLSSLSRAEKVGQLIAARVESTDTAEYLETLLTQYKVGAIIPLHPWKLEECTTLIQSIKKQYPKQIKTPVLICIDAEWGSAMRISELPAFPRALTLGALYPHNKELIYEVGNAIGNQCHSLGIHLNCAPVADVNSNPNNPVIGMRSFGDDPERVAACALAYAQGLADAGTIACLKHFPGHGNTDKDSHHNLPVITSTKEYITEYDIAPFGACLKQLQCPVMVGHLAIPVLEPDGKTVPATLSSTIISEHLRNKLNFDGLVISDALDMHALTAYGNPGDIALAALKAGIDILLCTPDIKAAMQRILLALETGEYTEAELDYHVLKILKLKELLGVHQSDVRSPEAPSLYEDLIQQAYDAAATAWNGFEALAALKKDAYTKVTLGSPILQKAPSYGETDVQEKPLLIYLYPGNNRTHTLTEELKNRLQEIATQNPHSRLLLFGSPYCLRDIPTTLPTLVLYEDTIYTHHTAEKIISGALAPQGTLPITFT